MALFKHLIYNKKACSFVRTQCDSQINGMMDQNEFRNTQITHDTAFQRLQTEFRRYMATDVISQTNFYRDLGFFSIL